MQGRPQVGTALAPSGSNPFEITIQTNTQQARYENRSIKYPDLERELLIWINERSQGAVVDGFSAQATAIGYECDLTERMVISIFE
jgi:hypothetical protein